MIMNSHKLIGYIVKVGLPIILIGIIIGFLCGLAGYGVTKLIGSFETEYQYRLVVKVFVIIGGIIGLGVAIQSCIRLLRSTSNNGVNESGLK